VIILALAVMSSLLVSILAATNEYGNIYHQYTPNVSIYTSTMDPSWAMVYSSDLSKLTSMWSLPTNCRSFSQRKHRVFPPFFLVSGDGNHGIGLGGGQLVSSLLGRKKHNRKLLVFDGKNIDVIILYMIVLIITILIMIIEYYRIADEQPAN